MEHLTGLVAAPHTPMNADGSLNLNLVGKQAEHLSRCGVIGAFVCGTTGEGMSLTTAERMAVTERWREAAPKGLRVIVHVGHASAAESRALAAHAQQIGAWGIGAMAPAFLKPATVEDLVVFCGEIAAAAPRLPFYYYHIPSINGVCFSVAEFLRLAKDRIPTLAGVKFTYEDLMDLNRCLRFDNGRFDILFGRDEILLAGLALGVKGAVGSTYNFAAPVYHRIIAAFAKGDMATAQREQARATDMIAVLVKYGGLPAIKAAMKIIGLDCGPSRPPVRGLTPEQCQAMQAELEPLECLAYYRAE